MSPVLSRALILALIEFVRVQLVMFLGFLLAVLLVRQTILAAHRHAIVARPTARGSHTVPTPRLGGLGVAAAVFVILASMQVWRPPDLSPWLAAFFVGGAFALVGGMLDDVLELDPRWKFMFQFAAAGTAALMGVGIHTDLLPAAWTASLGRDHAAVLNQMVSGGVTFVAVVFFMNAYNFMDGMDGQAAIYGSLVAIGLYLPWLAARPFFAPPEVFAMAAVAGALLGLFWYNHPGKPAGEKTFMGDSGSQFIGYALALTALHSAGARLDTFSVVSALILFSPFAWDVVYTLLRRIVRGENILEAHRSHLYQRLLVAGWNHTRVLFLNIALWISCFALALNYPRVARLRGGGEALLVVLATVLLLTLYTLFVLWVERRARSGQTPPA